MLEYYGKYAGCKIFTDEVEETAISQVYNMLNSIVFDGCNIRIMPDIHAGAGTVIGFTSTITDKIIPNVIGVDIGCGVDAWKLANREIDFQMLDDFIRNNIPYGYNVHDTVLDFDAFLDDEHKYFKDEVEIICASTKQKYHRVLKSLGSLGGGNHFIEIDKDQNGDYWLLIHSGSRNFGLQIATYYQKIAVANMGKCNRLEYLEDNYAEEYLRDMKVAQFYADLNRKLMGHLILNDYLEMPTTEYVSSVHNYISFDDHIIRKGAISAHKDEKVVIPWNMKDGAIIGTGLGNEDWNCSAPHGAGRTMSRSKAKKEIKLEDFEQCMSNVWSSCISSGTLDEAPQAYKSYKKIQDALSETVRIDYQLKPVYNFKAS